MYVEKEEQLKGIGIDVKEKVLLVEWNYSVSFCNPYCIKTETSIEVKELYFDFDKGKKIKIKK